MEEKFSERVIEVIRLLDLSKDYYDPNESRNHISGFVHALRVAELLEHIGKKNPWFAFAGLVHDLARPLNDIYHGEIIAEVVRDRVPAYIYHILRTHGLYQEAIMHNLENPVLEEKVIEECQPFNFQKLALMFAANEELSFAVEYKSPGEPWTYEKAKERIISVLN